MKPFLAALAAVSWFQAFAVVASSSPAAVICTDGPICNCGGGCPSDHWCSCHSCGSCNNCSTCVCCLPDIPPEWKEAEKKGDLLYSPTEVNVRMPSIGNGFLATEINAECIYTAGVFNGEDPPNKDITHRACIPSTFSPKLEIVSNSTDPFLLSGSALDLRHGMFSRRYATPASNLSVKAHIFAHRASYSVGVVHLETDSDQEVKVTVDTNELSPTSSPDFDASVNSRTITLQDGSKSLVTIFQGTTKTKETPSMNATRIALVTTCLQNQSVVLHRSMPFHLITAIKSSLDGTDPLSSALEAYVAAASANPNTFKASHEDAWNSLWESGLDVQGRHDVAVAVNSSLYFLLSSIRADVAFSISPGGLATNGYNGHSFWDCETWMFPAVLMWFPEIAASLLQYRFDRLDGARSKARSYKPPYLGAMFPWESAVAGTEACPASAATGQFEQHISGDIAFAARQYFEATGSVDWLKNVGFPLVQEIAEFWVSKAVVDAKNGSLYHIKDVIPPDEYARGDDSVFTNYVAKLALEFAVSAANTVGVTPKAAWSTVADGLAILFDPTLEIHPEYEGYSGEKIKQADVVLLGFPLMMPMPSTVRRNDLDYYSSRTDPNGPAMTWGMHAVGYLELNDTQKAASNFNRSFANAQPPFQVWTETPTGGANNFITGVGGFLQTALFGYPGLRLQGYQESSSDEMKGLRVQPVLVEGAVSMTARGVKFRGFTVDISYDSKSTSFFLRGPGTSGANLSLTDLSTNPPTTEQVPVGTPVTKPSGHTCILRAQ